MPSTAELERIDEAHRLQQAANAAALVTAMRASFAKVIPTSLAASGTIWLAEAIALIVGARRRSGLLALTYSQQIRKLHLPGEPTIVPPILPDPNLEQLRESLTFVGLKRTAIEMAMTPQRRALLIPDTAGAPEALESLLRENDAIEREGAQIDAMLRQVMQRAQQRVGAAAVRHTQNGGRDAVAEFIKTDKKARGYIRVTRPAPCFFCAMLASRGPVYTDDSFEASNAKFKDDPRDIEHGTAKVHDSCGCHNRPVYTRDGSEWTSVARESSDIWEDIRREKGRTPTIDDFRTRWDSRNASMQ